MTETCDLCRSSHLEPVYEPMGSERGLRVHVCANCGLLQSLPRTDRAPRRGATVSSGADWGNVRYGKGFRTEACLSMIRAHANFAAPLSVLDVGSNRGAFARAMLASAARVELTCVEPDERVAASCAGLERSELLRTRIEATKFAAGSFDIVHSCHTIEHLASPKRTLADHWRVLKPGGLLIVDAPNVALIGSDDIVEEWFIDKHLYHFSEMTLARLIESAGFDIIGGPNPKDRENLLFAARKREIPPRPVRRDPYEVDAAMALITSYVSTRAINVAALSRVAAEIAALAPRRVALWGAGRLFDALVLRGGFNPKMLSLLVDTHLKAHVAERHGVTLAGPEALATVDPQIIVVMSRAFSEEIVTIVSREAPNAEILLYSDLLSRARTRHAA